MTEQGSGPDWAAVFQVWLKDMLTERGWKAADLARASNVSDTRISNWMNGQNRPTLAGCRSIAHGLGVPEEAAMSAAGYRLARRLSNDEAWNICFGDDVPAEARDFLLAVYRAWQEDHPTS